MLSDESWDANRKYVILKLGEMSKDLREIQRMVHDLHVKVAVISTIFGSLGSALSLIVTSVVKTLFGM